MQKTVKDLMITLGEAAARLKAAAEPDVYISQTDFSTLQNDLEGDERELVSILHQLLLDREAPNGRLTKSDVDAAVAELQNDFLLCFELNPGDLSTSEESRFEALGSTYLNLARVLKRAATPTVAPDYPAIAAELGRLAAGLSFGEVYAPKGHEPFEGIYVPAGIANINRSNFLPALAQVERFNNWDTLYRNVRTEDGIRPLGEFIDLQKDANKAQAEAFIERFRTDLDRHEIVTVEENQPGSGYPMFWIGFTPEDDWVGIWTLSYR